MKYLLVALFFPVAVQAQVEATFLPIPASYDINSANPVYALDVNYDDLDVNRQAFHLFLPDTSGTYPLVVYIHGGGFTGGSRDVVLSNPGRLADIKFFLERGIAFASIGYRVLPSTGPDSEGVIKCLSDAKRGLQFLRYYAEDLYLRPEQVAILGTSAGAGTGLWLATHPDMADPDATDPVLRESTRICAVATGGSQSTYDLYRWESEVYQDYDGQGANFTLDSIVDLLGFERASNFYGGLDSAYQIVHDEALIQYRQDVDMLYHMSADDPPIYVVNQSGAVLPRQDLFHHSLHGERIVEAALAANLTEVKATIRATGFDSTEGESINEFLLRHLSGCDQTTGTSAARPIAEVSIYPNPAKTLITINMDDQDLIAEVALYSLSGQLMLAQHEIYAQALTLPIASLPRGLYVARIRSSTGRERVQKVAIR